MSWRLRRHHCGILVVIKNIAGKGFLEFPNILNAMTDTLKPLNDSDGIRVPICDTSRLLPQLAKCAEFLI